MNKVNTHNKQRGFTILELMVVIAVAGILAAFALPNFDIMMKNNCLVTKTNTLISSLQFTRSEAVKRNSPVSMTAFNAGDATNEWGSGWNIVDNATTNTIRVVQVECAATTADDTSTPNKTTITYAGDGFIQNAGTIQLCDDRTGETGRLISVSVTGRPGVADVACP